MNTTAKPKPRAWLEIHKKVLKLIDSLGSPANRKVLDAPLGPGTMAWELHDLGYAVTGADIDVQQSNNLPAGIVRQKCDLNGPLPFADGSFDLITSLEGIEHVENHFLLLREFGRVLRPGGQLIISTPNICSLEQRLHFLERGTFYRFIRREEIEQKGSGFDHQNLISYVELRQVLDWAGFQIERVEKDRPKWRQVIFLLPLWLFLRANLALQSNKRKAKYLLSETSSNAVLLGGNTIILQAKKTG
ncbi:MAG: methyltransferase domain-containing protein [Verrucomicrobiota bacterium]|nr:methyltransferase domain-containing protein [Verrucomicrobiota bacterium]